MRRSVVWAACGWVAALSAFGEESVRIVYVSPAGNDRWSGRLTKADRDGTDGPFASLERARDAVRELKRDGGVPVGGVRVEILGGSYRLTRPFALTAEDSGAEGNPVVYAGQTGTGVVLSGGLRVADWHPVSDSAVLARLTDAARRHVVQADLRAMGIADYGDLGMDAEAGIQKWLARADNQGEYALGSTDASVGKRVSPRLELFFNGQPMTLSRGPNEGEPLLTISEVLGKTPIDVRGVKGCVEGVFSYAGDRPSRWANEPDAWVRGFWFRDWAEQAHRIRSLDTAAHRIEVEPPYHGYGYRKGQWFYGMNLLCELDQPGEWMIDRTSGILYFWPPSSLKAGLAEVSVSPGLVTVNDATNVVIQGLVFETARGTGVAMSHSVRCSVIGCTFRNLANHGVTVFGGREDAVRGCDLYGLGGGGIYLVGGDRATLTPGGHVAENNHIHHFARWDRMYRPGVMISGVGNRVAHNLIHDAPHAAILFGGNDHLIEYNEIHSACYDSNDCGAIYAGRSWTLRGTVIRYNYLHHLYGRPGGPCKGIYLDDLFSSAAVYGNLFYQVTYAVFLGGGRDNIIENNVFVDCPKAVQVDARALGWCGPHADGRIREAQTRGTIAGIRYRDPPYSERYPGLSGLLDDEPKKPKGNVFRCNIFWPGDGADIRRVMHGTVPTNWWNAIDNQSRPYVKVEDNLTDLDPLFADTTKRDFRLTDASPAWALGFRRLPIERMGLVDDASRASWPVAHAPRPLPEK